jgi:Septum formation
VLRALLCSLVVALTASCTGAGDLVQGEAGTASPRASIDSTGQPQPSDSISGSPTPRPVDAGTPRAGVCRKIRLSDLNTVVNDRPGVPCRGDHTSVTYHVGTLANRVAADASSSGDDRVEAAADRLCARAFPPYVGGTRSDRALSSLRITYFLPEAQEFQAGARWVRCDLFAYASQTALAALPGRMMKALDKPVVRSRMGICSTVGPDRPTFEHIVCARAHRWRAVSLVRLDDDAAPFPGPRRLAQRARQRCEPIVRAYLDTREAFAYGFEVPRAASWNNGQRFGYCWARSEL